MQALPAAGIVAFTASPDAVPAGEAVTLAWETTQAAAVSIEGGDGHPVDLTGRAPGADSVVVHPQSSTTYRLTATAEGGDATAEAAVTVWQHPSIDAFAVTPAEPRPPESSTATLSWSTTHATDVSLVDGSGQELPIGNALEGSLEITPAVSTTYTLSASGPGGATSRDLTVHVLALADRFTVEPAVARAGDTLTLSWATRGATEVEMAGPGGFVHRPDAASHANGQITTPASATGTYTLRAASTANQMILEDAVTATEGPLFRTFAVSQTLVSQGQTVQVSWTADGAESVALSVDGETVDVTGVQASGGTLEVALTTPGDADLELMVANASGLDRRNATVQVIPPAAVVSFAAFPVRTHAGGEVGLSWQTRDAVDVRLEKDGVDLGVPPTSVNGSTQDALLADSEYVLIVRNALGAETVSEPLTVTVGPPDIRHFAVTPDRVTPAEAVSFAWEVAGGSNLKVTDAALGVVHETTSVSEIAQGSASATSPVDLGEHVFTLSVGDGAGDTSEGHTTLTVSDGPIIRSFTVDLTAATVNDTVTLSWIVSDDLAGQTPTLAIDYVSPDGEAHPLDGMAERDPNAGSADVFLDQVGTWTFTLTAGTGSGPDHARTVSVDVIEAPAIVTAGAAPEALSTTAGGLPTSTLSWETTHAGRISVEFYSGQGLYETLFESDEPAAVAQGQLEVHPAVTTSYRIVARNAVGAVAEHLLQVSVDAPRIARLEILNAAGQPVTEALLGEKLDVVWETEQADLVAVSPVPTVPFRQVARGFVDISEAGTEIPVAAVGPGDRTVFKFPAGFRFPWEGRLVDQVAVHNAGYIDFDPTESSDWGNKPIPSDLKPQGGALMPFWDYVKAGDNGKLFWAKGHDAAKGDYLLVQWSHYTYGSFKLDLNFQVRLWADGDVEYHYGSMTALNPAEQKYADGFWAGIGLERTYGRFGTQVSHDQEFQSGLSNQGFVFDLHTTPAGRAALDTASRNDDKFPYYNVAVTAQNDKGTAFARKALVIYAPAEIQALGSLPTQPGAGETVTVSWQFRFGRRAALLDPDGREICAQDANPVSTTGTVVHCEIGSQEPGTYHYKLVVLGPLDYDTRELDVPVTWYAPFGINAFTANDSPGTAFASAEETVRLAWDVTGAAALEIYANGEPLDLELGTPTPTTGFVDLVPSGPTRYVLRASEDATFTARIAELPVMVYVGAANMRSLSLDRRQVAAGEAVTLTWSSRDAEDVFFRSSAGAFSGTTRGHAFTSITEDPRVSDVPIGNLGAGVGEVDTALDGFAFPLDGERIQKFMVASEGYVSLDPTHATADSSSERLPFISKWGILAPFWRSLFAGADSRLVYLVDGTAPDRTLTIEWYRYTFGTTYEGTTTFQLVLHETGTMEFRYVDVAPRIREVDLTWTAPDATEVRITDQHGNVVVDTTAGTLCGAAPCQPQSDMIRVGGISDGTTWTIAARNDLGTDTESIYADWFQKPDVGFAAVLDADGTTATLNWEADQGTSNNRMTTAVRILDPEGTVVLDTAEGIGCTGACDPGAGTLTVPVPSLPRTWTLQARNAFGEQTRIATLTPAGAPTATLSGKLIGENGAYEVSTWYKGLKAVGAVTIRDWDEFAGRDATVGWNNLAASFGDLLLYKFPNPETVASGVRHLFHPSLPASGSATFRPGETATYEICVEGGGYRDCRHDTVVVVQPGSFLFTEIKPAATPDAQWVEVRNTSADPIDVAGWTFESTTGSASLPPDPRIVAPGEFLVLAREGTPALNGGLPPVDLAWGASSPSLLLGGQDALTFRWGGLLVDEVAYGADWTAVENASWSLDPFWHGRDPSMNDAFAQAVPTGATTGEIWCASDETYGDAGHLGSPGAVGPSCRFAGRPYAIRRSGASFIDLTARTTATDLPTIWADGEVQVPGGVGFDFSYFGQPVTQVWVYEYGYLAFADTAEVSTPREIPNSQYYPHGHVAGLWGAIQDNPWSRVLYDRLQVDGHQVFIAQWTGVRTGSSTYALYEGDLSFQIQLWDTGDIAVAYREIDPRDDSANAYSYYHGGYHSVGLENQDASDGVQFSFKEPVIDPYSGILFVRQQP